MRCCVIIPTLNAAGILGSVFDALAMQSLQPDEILVIDSDSRDGTAALAAARGGRVHRLNGRKFNHGGTRQFAATLTQCDVLIFLTQDAVPADADALANLVAALTAAPDIGAAYGRQLPSPGAGPLARYHRLVVYPATGDIRRLADVPRLGIKTCHASDSFAAYRSDVLRQIGGFPEDVLCCEDVHVVARMMLAGFGTAYAADARVYHSHDYTLAEEFRRYFDNGVFYGREAELLQPFGGATGEGLRFLRGELSYLTRSGHLTLVPVALLHTAAKFLGFRLGHVEKHLPQWVKRRIGLYHGYWIDR